MMGQGIFITGTDTEVGKTFVTACLARLFIHEGFDVGVMKPAETGCPRRKGKLIPKDATYLKTVSGSRDSLSLINPYRFSRPLAPLIAAKIDHKKIHLGKISLAYRRLRERHDLVLVEGAGGLLVPLTRRLTNLGLILKLKLPAIVVVGSKLGAINHTLLTLRHAKENGVRILGLVINHPNPNPGHGRNLAEKTNPGLLRLFTEVPVIGEIPYLSSISKFSFREGSILMNILKRVIYLEEIKTQIL
jgi:dethiobiotin synthetase